MVGIIVNKMNWAKESKFTFTLVLSCDVQQSDLFCVLDLGDDASFGVSLTLGNLLDFGVEALY